jgi:hypothetical protein
MTPSKSSKHGQSRRRRKKGRLRKGSFKRRKRSNVLMKEYGM